MKFKLDWNVFCGTWARLGQKVKGGQKVKIKVPKCNRKFSIGRPIPLRKYFISIRPQLSKYSYLLSKNDLSLHVGKVEKSILDLDPDMDQSQNLTDWSLAEDILLTNTSTYTDRQTNRLRALQNLRNLVGGGNKCVSRWSFDGKFHVGVSSLL